MPFCRPFCYNTRMITGKAVKYMSCPIDGESLVATDKYLKCDNGHTFDISKEGYVNFLVSKKRFNKEIGDNKEMLQARDRFLTSGHYDPLSNEIGRLINKYFKNKFAGASDSCVLEVGSGIAFYLNNLKQILDKDVAQEPHCYIGTDISKSAIQFSSKKYKDISFLVADTYSKLPIKDNSVSILLNIFSPRNPREFKRALNDDGLLLTVIPNNDHLKEIVDELGLISVEKQKKEKLSEKLSDYFKKIKDKDLKYTLTLNEQSLTDLIKMSPSYYLFDSQHLEQKIQGLKYPKRVTASFNISLYKLAKSD